jgi:hypothetical protein
MNSYIIRKWYRARNAVPSMACKASTTVPSQWNSGGRGVHVKCRKDYLFGKVCNPSVENSMQDAVCAVAVPSD